MLMQKCYIQLLILTGSVLVSNLVERRREAAVTLAMLPKDGTDSKVQSRITYSVALGQTIYRNGWQLDVKLDICHTTYRNHTSSNE